MTDVVDLIHITEENVDQIKNYDVIYFTGGDVAPLGEIVTERIKDALINFLSNNGVIIGESAGSIIFGEDFKWYYDVKRGTKPKYDIELPSYKGFGLIDENIYPHYNKANEEHKQDELGLIISNSSARAEIEKQLEQAKKYLEECVYNVVSPERLRKDIEQFLKENE